MKNSREYTQKLRKLYQSLKGKYPKVQSPAYERLVDAFVYAIISEKMTLAAAQTAIRKINDYFVDLNELRVSQVEEIGEMLGEDISVTRNIATALSESLRVIFNKYNQISLESLKKVGKRPAKLAIERIDGASHFVSNYCMLTYLHGHAMPLTEGMMEYLKKKELVHPSADQQEIEGFLTRQIPAKNMYEFYVLLRQESELSGAGTGTEESKAIQKIKKAKAVQTEKNKD
jgi:endonuclease III